MADDARRNNLVVATIALAATITSLRNGFAYDDIPIIATNERVHHLASWWSFFGTSYWPPQYGESLYRPMSMLAYALEWALGNGSPMLFHAVSIALFILLAILVLMLLRELLDGRAALVGGVLFAAHPIHTEAVANVVGQAELLAAIGVVGATIVYLRARRAGGPTLRQTAGIAALYAGAALAKEHALFLPLIIGAAELILYRESPRSPGVRSTRTRRAVRLDGGSGAGRCSGARCAQRCPGLTLRRTESSRDGRVHAHLDDAACSAGVGAAAGVAGTPLL